MSFYLFDFFVNNLNIFVSATILFKLGSYKRKDFIFLLFIDIFINRIPIIFISILLLNLLNKWIRKRLVNSFVLDNLLFLKNYILFFLIIFLFRNESFVVSDLIKFYLNNFLINYMLFLLTNKTFVSHDKRKGWIKI